jgi:hypothetical protein
LVVAAGEELEVDTAEGIRAAVVDLSPARRGFSCNDSMVEIGNLRVNRPLF